MIQTVIIFDIDGTLLKSEHLDARFFVRAVRDVAGDIRIADDWSSYKKVTDIGIITEILKQNGIGDIPHHIVTIRERFGELLHHYFSNGGVCAQVPGSNEFLRLLAVNPTIRTGIATGGWQHSARMKLDAANMDIGTIPISTSDNGDDRTEIMMHCFKQIQAQPAHTVYIGDGVWDREASRKLGWQFIGIGEKLRNKCACWFKDFKDPAAIIRSITNGTPDPEC